MAREVTLLQKAMKYRERNKRIDVPMKQMIEVSLAWVRDEVTLTQLARGLGLNNTGTRAYSKIALALKYYLKSKKLTHGK